MSVAAYLYPWDVAGDPRAADVVAGLGLDHVVLAAQYHATRALTPRHPAHRIVVAPYSEAHHRGEPFRSAVSDLRAAGVAVRAWVVVNHVDLPAPGGDHVVNAFGDAYPWALCPARPAVLARAVAMAAEVAALDGIDGVELESCGWYGFDHLSAHDKSGGIPASPAMEFLLSLCFCAVCEDGFRRAGLGALREHARRVIDRLMREPAASSPVGEWAGIAGVIGEPLAGEVLAVRRRVADGFRAAVVGELRRLRPGFAVDLHASPMPHRGLAFTGVDPATAGRLVDGLVVNCWTGPEAVAATRRAGGDDPAERRPAVYASLLAVAGLGGRGDLVAQADAARRAGADGVRLYHAGLAGDADLAAIRALTGRPR